MFQLNLQNANDKIDISSMVPSTYWIVTNATAKRNVKRYACCPEEYHDITYTLGLKRIGHGSYSVYAGPALVLAVLIPFLFLLPSSGGGRLTLGELYKSELVNEFRNFVLKFCLTL